MGYTFIKEGSSSRILQLVRTCDVQSPIGITYFLGYIKLVA